MGHISSLPISGDLGCRLSAWVPGSDRSVHYTLNAPGPAASVSPWVPVLLSKVRYSLSFLP